MKGVVAIVALLVVAGLVRAQERIPSEVAQKFARLFVEQTAKLDAPQLKVEPDAERPYGLKKDEMGALFIPDKRLSAEALQKAGKEVLPVGQLWVRGLTAVVNDQPVANDKLRIVTISADNKDHALPLFLVGARRSADGELQLVVYGKDKKPLLHVPLRKAETRQELPVELEGREENERGVLTLNLLGRYRAELVLAKQD
jgi:hypothetical protein